MPVLQCLTEIKFIFVHLNIKYVLVGNRSETFQRNEPGKPDFFRLCSRMLIYGRIHVVINWHVYPVLPGG